MVERRTYPIEPLLEATGMTMSQLAQALGIGGPEYRRYRDEGMTRDVAERKALKAGLHPYEVWLDMADNDLHDAERECAAPDCSNRFVPHPMAPRRRWCSSTCKSRTWAREAYTRDPEPKRQKVRQYDAESRELKRRYNRSYYRRNRSRLVKQQQERDRKRRLQGHQPVDENGPVHSQIPSQSTQKSGSSPSTPQAGERTMSR